MIGYPAGVITGIAYGLNPLFAKPLMNNGAATEAILFFRYAIAVALLGGFLLIKRESFKVTVFSACHRLRGCGRMEWTVDDGPFRCRWRGDRIKRLSG